MTTKNGNTKLPKTHYTIVQHSGWGEGSNPQFRAGLEAVGITTYAELNKVQAAGGRVFDSYTEAEGWAEHEQYPPGVEGLIPQAPGTFSSKAHRGLLIYLPAPAVLAIDNNVVQRVAEAILTRGDYGTFTVLHTLSITADGASGGVLVTLEGEHDDTPQKVTFTVR